MFLSVPLFTYYLPDIGSLFVVKRLEFQLKRQNLHGDLMWKLQGFWLFSLTILKILFPDGRG